MPTPSRSLPTGDQPSGEVEKRITAPKRRLARNVLMISILDSKKILNSGDRKYTDDEVMLIRAYLYLIGKIQTDINNYKDLEDDDEL